MDQSKNSNKCRVSGVFFIIIFLLIPVITKAQKKTGDIAGAVHLPTNYQLTKGQKIYIFLLTDGTFKKPYTGIRKIKRTVSKKVEEKVHFMIREVEKGYYALRCFVDENNNGEMDTFFMIPREPWGLSWQEGRSKIPPHFNDVSFYVDEEVTVDLFLKD